MSRSASGVGFDPVLTTAVAGGVVVVAAAAAFAASASAAGMAAAQNLRLAGAAEQVEVELADPGLAGRPARRAILGRAREARRELGVGDSRQVGGITLGLFVWFCFLQSGVHATIAGVILAFLTPSGQVPAITPKQIKESNDSSALERWETALHPWVSYLIMPIFAFFNAGVELKGITVADLLQNTVSLGILSGLIFGKPIGIFLSSFIAVKAKLAYLPDGVSWNHILGAGFLGGVGFTMSLFINNLAFSTSGIDTYSKSAILLASAVAGFAGYVSLLLITKPSKPNQ